jgi:AcrR family transcriptional regulator
VTRSESTPAASPDSPAVPDPAGLPARPKRADARRNYEKVLAAARAAFGERGAGTSLEEIARRAGVGIGTLYRHFPTRQALLEAVYVDEVADLARSAEALRDDEPWEALSRWLRRVSAYLVTKQALAAELLDSLDREAPLFATCKTWLYDAGEPLLARAQAAGEVRPDVSLPEIIQMVGGIAKIQTAEPDAIDRILSIALDGLRVRA